MQDGLDTRQLAQLAKDLETIAQDYPDRAKKHLQTEGNNVKKRLYAETRDATTKRTGNLLKGVRRMGVKKRGGDLEVTVTSKAPHAHLIEHGHVFYHRGKKTEKFVPGKHPAADATKELKAEFPRDAEAFVDRLIKEGFEL